MGAGRTEQSEQSGTGRDGRDRANGGELGVLGLREHPFNTVHPVRLSNYYRSSETYVMQTCCVLDEYLT